MIKMVTKQELELEMETWRGVNKYLFKSAMKRLRMGLYEKPEVLKKEVLKAKPKHKPKSSETKGFQFNKKFKK